MNADNQENNARIIELQTQLQDLTARHTDLQATRDADLMMIQNCTEEKEGAKAMLQSRNLDQTGNKQRIQ